MALRLNPNPAPDLLAAIQLSRHQQAEALHQIASGRRVNSLADDPAAAAALVSNRAQSGEVDQFLRNVSSLRGSFQLADSALNSAVATMNRAIALGIQGANGTLSPQNRQALATEVRALIQQLVGLGNTSNGGNFVFAGTSVQAPPFVLDPTAPSGVRYTGNSNTISIELLNGQTAAINMPGDQIFMNASGDVFAALNQLATALVSGMGIDTANTAVQSAFAQLNTRRVFYGNGLHQLDLSESFLQREKLDLSRQENDLVGADLPTSIINLSQAQAAGDAVLAATARILSSINLLDVLK